MTEDEIRARKQQFLEGLEKLSNETGIVVENSVTDGLYLDTDIIHKDNGYVHDGNYGWVGWDIKEEDASVTSLGDWLRHIGDLLNDSPC